MNTHRNIVILASSLSASLAGTPIALAQDLNANVIEDSRDLRLGTSADCNANGLVDERDASAPHFTQAIEHLNGLEQFQNNVWDARPIDFNNDGLPDLVVSSMYSTNVGAVSFWRNEGGPGLVHVTRLLMPDTRPYTLRVGDLNADGRSDFVASDASFNQAYVFLATGSETFANPVTLVGPPSNNGSVGIDLGDLDNDGDLDLAWSCWYPATINVFMNNGQGVFSAGATFSTGAEPRDIAIADFSGDGLPDIAAANQFYYNPANGTVSLHRNNGNGTFTLADAITMPSGVPPYNYQAKPQFTELIDIDNDGDNDLVTSSDQGNTLAIHRNNGTGAFTLSQTLGGWWLESESRDVLIVDLDADDLPEIVWGDVDMHSVRIYRNTLSAPGMFEHYQNFASANYGAHILAAADFSGDGLIDIASTNETSRTFCVMENLGDLNFDATVHLRPDEFPSKAQLADFTSDGITDLLVIRQPYTVGTVNMSVYAGLGGKPNMADFANTSIDTPLSLATGAIFTRDVNNDNRPDILDVTGHCYVYMGVGDGTFAAPIVSPIMPYGLRAVTGDINLDGHMDLAWIWPGHPSLLRVSLGDGAGNFGAFTEYTDVAEDESIGIGDITGDGYPEVFTGHRLGILSIHPNNGDGTFGPRTDITIAGSPLMPSIGAIAVADFDLDGDNEVVVSAVGLKMFFNAGAGALLNPPVTVSPYSASILTVADVDLDGTPDLYGRAGRTIAYLNTQGTGFFDITMLLRFYDSNARTMIVADANNDGRLDVMIGPENSWSQYLFLNLPSVSEDLNGNSVPDECEGGLPGDTNGDGVVNVDDLVAVILGWGACPTPPGRCPGDVNHDGGVNVDDLTVVILNWG